MWERYFKITQNRTAEATTPCTSATTRPSSVATDANGRQPHHTTCCSPRYKWSSTGSSSTSNSFTMLGWCSFFSIAISLYTLSKGFTDDLILLGAARPATTQWWSFSLTLSVCTCRFGIHLSCFCNILGHYCSDYEEWGRLRRYVLPGSKYFLPPSSKSE